MKRIVIFIFIFILSSSTHSYAQRGESSGGGLGDIGIGMPIGGSKEVDTSICPQGVNVLGAFMEAWKVEDYKRMYSLIDSRSLEEYPFDQARFDFQFMEFKPYKISSIRKDGDNYEFMLTHGDWKDGDKEIKKVIISGKSYKIILQKNRSIFKESLASYF